MGIGDNVKSTVSNVINSLGTTVTILDVTPVLNARGATTSYTVNSSGTVKCVPSSFFKSKLGLQPFGHLNEGDIRMLFPSGTAYTNLVGTANSWRGVITIDNYTGTYIPKVEKPIILQGEVMAYPVTFVIDTESGY